VIKHVFTGNLNATIDTCPPFPGKERHLLRAQLARISHGTELCPKGIYEIEEEEGKPPVEKLAEEAPDTGTAALAEIGAWAHRHQVLLEAGRCTHIAPPGLSEE
jgi:radial spoke head protein 4/6